LDGRHGGSRLEPRLQTGPDDAVQEAAVVRPVVQVFGHLAGVFAQAGDGRGCHGRGLVMVQPRLGLHPLHHRHRRERDGITLELHGNVERARGPERKRRLVRAHRAARGVEHFKPVGRRQRRRLLLCRRRELDVCGQFDSRRGGGRRGRRGGGGLVGRPDGRR